MKRFILSLLVAFVAIWSVNALAATTTNFGVVDMQKIFQSSPQVKKIRGQLKKQFASKRAKMIKMGKSLQANMKKYQKEKLVQNQKSLTALQKKINKQGLALRQAQAKLQQAAFVAQNRQMGSFISKVKSIVKTLAKKKGLGIVLPKNSVLYSQSGMDLTPEVLAKLQ